MAHNRLICGQYYNNKINTFIIQYLNKITVHNGPGLFKYFHSHRFRSMPYRTKPRYIVRHIGTESIGRAAKARCICLFCLIASATQLYVSLTEVSNNDDDDNDDDDTNWYASC